MLNLDSSRWYMSHRRLHPVLIGVLMVPLYAGSAVLPTSSATDSSKEVAQVNPGPVSDSESLGPKYNLRCWQYGRLILEESDLAPPEDGTARVLVLRQAAQAKAQLYLIETHNSTCLLKGHKP